MLKKSLAAQRTLPDFENLPAVETLMGVHFAPIVRWQSAYFGLFWARVKRDYPRTEMQPLILPQRPIWLPHNRNHRGNLCVVGSLTRMRHA